MPPSDGLVLTQGTFDLVHSNHAAFLREARAMGSRLVVGVHCDAEVTKYKHRPVLNERERLMQVQAIRWVDEAFIDYEVPNAASLEALIQKYQPAHYVYGSEGWDEMFEPAIRRGILRRLPYRAGISTSRIIATIRQRLDEGSL
ncbi:MAG: adenylyltransferase/cytidyltransferase family protein [Rhodobacteraceae bacterium]|nr:adenylyltransferase/cytidyltransferase family protein [Paracoccaceae bacterium]